MECSMRGDGDCARWNKSSYCESQLCVEVAWRGGGVLVRDSVRSDDRLLSFSAACWTRFVDAVKADEIRMLCVAV
jgi:hypothetical protein